MRWCLMGGRRGGRRGGFDGRGAWSCGRFFSFSVSFWGEKRARGGGEFKKQLKVG